MATGAKATGAKRTVAKCTVGKYRCEAGGQLLRANTFGLVGDTGLFTALPREFDVDPIKIL